MSIKTLTYHLCLAMPLMGLLFTPNIVRAVDGTVEIDLLEEFGLEVFETDPKKNKQSSKRRKKKKKMMLYQLISLQKHLMQMHSLMLLI